MNEEPKGKGVNILFENEPLQMTSIFKVGEPITPIFQVGPGTEIRINGEIVTTDAEIVEGMREIVSGNPSIWKGIRKACELLTNEGTRVYREISQLPISSAEQQARRARTPFDDCAKFLSDWLMAHEPAKPVISSTSEEGSGSPHGP